MLKSLKGLAKSTDDGVLCTGRKKKGAWKPPLQKKLKLWRGKIRAADVTIRKTLGGGTAGQTHACQDIPDNSMKRNYEMLKVNFKE